MKFREAKGYDGFLVSDTGIVKSAKTDKIRNQYTSPTGYVRVNIRQGGRWKTVSVHRLVADAFIPNPQNKPCVNHIDGNKANNNAENLEWCTHSENESHSYKCLGKTVSPEHIKKIIKLHKEAVSTPVTQFTLGGKNVRTFVSMAEAHRATGIAQSNISKCCNNERNQAGGYKWSFVI